MISLMQTLISFSERAAKIARVIRQDPRLFALLIEEKKGREKNQRFLQDFKTLADVLIQEALRHYVSLLFPTLSNYIKGEENAMFTNALGEKITVSVFKSQAKTAALLEKVLDGNVEAASVLAEVVHSNQIESEIREDLKNKMPDVPVDDIAFWIDPIDSTGEYVGGNTGSKRNDDSIFFNGLPCVTVLIGVYDRTSGIPIAGVINQPFSFHDGSRWQSGLYWGISHNGVSLHNLTQKGGSAKDKSAVVLSGSECSVIQKRLLEHFEVVLSSGAGYKGLTVCLGLAEAYICSKGSTFRWDTNAPHGLLRSLGGGIISYKSLIELGSSQLLKPEEILKHQILYDVDPTYDDGGTNPACNADGIVAYRDPLVLPKIYNCLKEL